jgi:hypothetical protein
MYFKEATSKTGQQQQHRRVKGADTDWRKGVRVGRAEATNEHVLCTEVGLRLTATVRRLPLESRYGRELIEKSLGVPWDPMSGVQRGRPKRILVEVNAIPALPVAAPAAGVEPAPAEEQAGAAEAAAPGKLIKCIRNRSRLCNKSCMWDLKGAQKTSKVLRLSSIMNTSFFKPCQHCAKASRLSKIRPHSTK